MAQDMFNKFLNKTNTGLEFIAALMESLKNRIENEGAQKIVEHYEKGKNCEAWECDPSVVKLIDARLTEAGVDHAFVQYPGDDNKSPIFLITKEEDRERVNAIKEQCITELKTISSMTLDELKKEGDVRTVAGVSPTFAGVFKEEAKRVGLPCSVEPQKDGTSNVYFLSRDESMANSVIRKTIESTIGVTGKLNGNRIAELEAEGKAVNNAILNAEQKETFVVSPDNLETLHITPNGYELLDKDGRSIDDKLNTNPKYMEGAHLAVAQFSQPVVMSKEEYERVRELPMNKRKKEIEKHRTKHHKVTKLTTRDEHALELERKARDLRLAYEKKLSIENNSLNTNFAGPESFAAFLARESTTDNQIKIESDRGVAMSVNEKEAPPDTHVLVNEFVELPPEDQEYIIGCVNEYYDKVGGLEKEDVAYEFNDINTLIDNASKETTITTTTRQETEIDVKEI